MKCWWPSGMCSWINILALKQHSFQINPILTISPTSTTKHSRNQMEIIVTDLVMRTALSWWAIPFSGILFPSPWWERMDFCHLQKLSRDLSAWWFISKSSCNVKHQCSVSLQQNLIHSKMKITNKGRFGLLSLYILFNVVYIIWLVQCEL